MAWWELKSWFTVWDGSRWLPSRRLTRNQADNWYIDTIELRSAHAPMAAIRMYQWDGATWKKVA